MLASLPNLSPSACMAATLSLETVIQSLAVDKVINIKMICVLGFDVSSMKPVRSEYTVSLEISLL